MRSTRMLTALLTTGALLAGAAPASAAAPQDRPEVRAAMTELLAAGAVGVQLRVHDRRGDWTASAGATKLGGRAPVPANGRFRTGSVTKVFVATVLLQLVGEGRVELDRPVRDYLPEFTVDGRITVRMLLQHTSGLFDYSGEHRPDGSIESLIPLAGERFVDSRFRSYQPAELVRLALTKPANFEPGTDWSYSNTNYLLAGLLIEKVTGTSYASQLRRRVILPLGLWDTSLPGAQEDIPGPHARGYYAYREAEAVRTVDVTMLNPSWAGAAGEMITTTKDLDTFLAALLGGELLSPPLLAEMRKTRPMADNAGYGLGLIQRDGGPGCGTMLGHTGGIHGYLTFAFASPDGSTRMVLSASLRTANLRSGDIADPATNEAAAAVQATVFCTG
ncbi:serine hydrolase [Crossiella sp. CA-258035]|uniref:serine hydrolase domain-containing protein n=1 Tax=Crossiella sp. CA-258035 TaxID=2981138 RepID=UPI0024BD54C9|nr:serine hydrolase domain-containing protein [Crossiella sp. CA-258035]WHT20655.1 serine hydrolase [Crossiella sp. CA-258035]